MQKKVYNLIILDESGSMAAIASPVVSGLMEQLQQISIEAKDEMLEQWVNFYSFNGEGIKELLPIQKVLPGQTFSLDKYQPESMTPLYDAIGYSVNKIRYELEGKSDWEVLVSIFTDGAENASKEYTGSTIANMIKKLSGEGWTFTYRGANHDVEETAAKLNISEVKRFYSDSESVNKLMDDEMVFRKAYYSRIRIDSKEKPDNEDIPFK